MGRLVAAVLLTIALGSMSKVSAQIVPGERWSFPEVTINAPGLEHAYLVIVPYQGGVDGQSAYISIARDGRAQVDPQREVALPSETTTLGRRTTIHLNDWSQFTDGQLHIGSLKINCPSRCTTQLILRPADAARFWSGMVIVKPEPEVEFPEVK